MLGWPCPTLGVATACLGIFILKKWNFVFLRPLYNNIIWFPQRNLSKSKSQRHDTHTRTPNIYIYIGIYLLQNVKIYLTKHVQICFSTFVQFGRPDGIAAHNWIGRKWTNAPGSTCETRTKSVSVEQSTSE